MIIKSSHLHDRLAPLSMKHTQRIKNFLERKKLEVNREYLEYILKEKLETKLKTANFPTLLTSQFIKPLEESTKDILIGTVLGDGMLDKERSILEIRSRS